MLRIFRRGHSIMVYTMLIVIVAAALMAMTVYITRSVNARVKQTEDEYKLFTGG